MMMIDNNNNTVKTAYANLDIKKNYICGHFQECIFL